MGFWYLGDIFEIGGRLGMKQWKNQKYEVLFTC